ERVNHIPDLIPVSAGETIRCAPGSQSSNTDYFRSGSRRAPVIQAVALDVLYFDITYRDHDASFFHHPTDMNRRLTLSSLW
ncbi:MAG: hypothetical protein ACRCR0_03390, partial [Edwardsiella piscicida]